MAKRLSALIKEIGSGMAGIRYAFEAISEIIDLNLARMQSQMKSVKRRENKFVRHSVAF